MSLITLYPRHYSTRGGPGDSVVMSNGDNTVEALYRLLLDRTVNTQSWTFRKKVLESALRLFGDFQQWLGDQRANPRVTGFNEAFIDDCLLFVREGRREMSLQNWVDLLSEGDQTQRVRPENFTPARLALSLGESTIQVLQDWCSHPGGIEDLTTTLHVLFGGARRTTA